MPSRCLELGSTLHKAMRADALRVGIEDKGPPLSEVPFSSEGLVTRCTCSPNYSMFFRCSFLPFLRAETSIKTVALIFHAFMAYPGLWGYLHVFKF